MLVYPISFGAGLLAALSPCVLPVLPMIAGSSTSKSKKGPLFLALGLVLSLVVVGLLFSVITNLFGLTEDQIRLGSAVMLLTFGIVLLVPKLKEKLSSFLTPLSNSSFKFTRNFDDIGNKGQFAIGAMLGFAWSPCVGPTLGLAMTMASVGSERFQAGLIMLVFGLGLVTPLMGIAYGLRGFFQRQKHLFFKMNKYGNQILGFSAALMAAMILTGVDKKIESRLVSALPYWYLAIITKF